jgi:hypothetical protein
VSSPPSLTGCRPAPPAPGDAICDPPPLPLEYRERNGVTYRGRRLLKPWWRWRLKVIGGITALVTVGAVAAGLEMGRLALRLTEM